MCPFRRHQPVYVMTTPSKLHIPLMLRSGSCSRMAEMHIFLWLEASWCQPISKPMKFFDCPCLFEGVNGEAVCFKARGDFVKKNSIFLTGIPKTPLSSRYKMTLSCPHRTCSIIYFAKSGAHFRSMSKHIYLYFPNRMRIKQVSWGSSSNSKVKYCIKIKIL